MPSSPSRTIGTLLIAGFIVAVVVSIQGRDCVCDDQQECFCLADVETLHDVTDVQLSRLPEPVKSEYASFLSAWEQEYAMRNEEWAILYGEFSNEYHTEEETDAFNAQLRKARRDFVLLFRSRDKLYRERNGIEL